MDIILSLKNSIFLVFPLIKVENDLYLESCGVGMFQIWWNTAKNKSVTKEKPVLAIVYE